MKSKKTIFINFNRFGIDKTTLDRCRFCSGSAFEAAQKLMSHFFISVKGGVCNVNTK